MFKVTRIRTAVAAVLIAAACGSLGLVLSALADAGPPPLSDTLGLEKISALDHLPSVVTVPPGLQFGISRAVAAINGDAASAESSLRRLRADVGETHSDVFVYHAAAGTLCLVLWQRQGTCSSVANPPVAGALYLLSPGGLGYAGAADPVSAEVVGVVSDDVKSVDVSIGQTSVAVPILDNSFAYEIPEAPTAAFTLSLQFTYADGSKRVVQVSQETPPVGIGRAPSK